MICTHIFCIYYAGREITVLACCQEMKLEHEDPWHIKHVKSKLTLLDMPSGRFVRPVSRLAFVSKVAEKLRREAESDSD